MQKIKRKASDIFQNLHRHYTLWRSVATRTEAYGYNTTDLVLLTFDDDGTPENIQGILAVLAKENVRAFFFINGDWAAAGGQNTRLIEDIKKHGHWVGSHSYDHIRLDRLSDSEVEEQLTKGLQTKYIRPPYGAYNARVRRIAHKLGFRISYWTVDSFDWKGISVSEIQENVLPKIHKGACVLLHLNTPHTLEALPGLIAGIRQRGYELCFKGNEVK